MDSHLRLCLVLLAALRPAAGQLLGCRPDQWLCDDGTCIPDKWKCDGEGDCLDGSDEMDCAAPPGAPLCPPGQFPCLDSVGCVDASARCDGQSQCPTGSDEENCTAPDGCLDSDWTCRNRLCVPKEQHCDGLNDCVDNSDEKDCGVCVEGSVRCPDGTCLSPEERCDGQVHCLDGSDEPITCGRFCSMNNGGCNHVCVDEPWGTLCVCRVGYKLSANGAVCEDVDECASPFSPCMHHCTNTIGSYYCHCRDGFRLNGNSICVATGNATRLLTVQRRSIGLLNVKSQQFEVVMTAVIDPVAVTFDIARGWYFWADGRGSIFKSDGRRSWTTYTGEPGIKSLACDWLNGNLYWTNQKTEAIYMQAADGDSYMTLMRKNISPSDLVLLPVESLMFWINGGPGQRVTIEKSWMDGSERNPLTVVTAQSAHSLTADVEARRLYWISDFKKSIETVKVDGTGRFSFSGMFPKRVPLSLAVFEGLFYWVDVKGLWQAPQNQHNQKRFLWKDDLPLLTVFHELQQPRGSSACVKTLCKLCQLTKGNPVGFSCTCPDFKMMLLDGSCQYPRFLYATSTNINLLEFREKVSSDKLLFSTDDGILSFDVGWYRDWLYWANNTGHIQRTSLTQVKTEVVPAPLPVCHIQLDQRKESLYWLSCDQNSLGTTAAGGGLPQQLYRTEGNIREFYLDWLRGGVIWLEGDRIFSMSKMGGKAKELLQLVGGVRGNMAFDLGANSLLWNSESSGLTAMSLLQVRSHQAGRRWNISGSVVGACEPFLLSLSDDGMTLWDRREGTALHNIAVRGQVVQVIAALGDVQTVPSSACREPSVLCRHSSVCLSQAQLCDGKQDCPEGDDEEFCVITCPSKEDFKCKDNSICIARNLACDGHAHCRDGSDEVDCPTLAPPASRPKDLRCRVGWKLCEDGTECVLYNHVCDGEVDCKDGSDELGCDATPTRPAIVSSTTSPAPTEPPCSSPSVLCPSVQLCISPSQFCDGREDCPDGFDEKTCVKSCPSMNDFRCEDRRSCVSKSLVCDGRAHCHDGSDEVSCAAVAAPAPHSNLLKCRVGSRLCRDETECVLFTHVCDGERDCRDGSDEERCDPAHNADLAEIHKSRSPAPVVPSTEPPTKPPCTSPSVLCPGSSLCIKPTQMCDGKRDCPDGSDENCVKRCPYRTDFLCEDRRSCVSKSLVCDGRSHCHDGSDEVSCAAVAAPAPHSNLLKCHVGSRLCRDESECVLFTHVCDGERDCRDGSDEEECDAAHNADLAENHKSRSPAPVVPSTEPPTKPPCTSPSVLCPGSSLCIKPTQMCDGKRDCPDGSDENCVNRCPYRTDFRCEDRRSCVSKSLVCDGRAHCHDGSDEVSCAAVAAPAPHSNLLKCRVGSRLCRDETECVLFTHVCDGERDCRDGSDEEQCDAAHNADLAEIHKSRSPAPVEPSTEPPTKPPCTSPSVLCPGSSLCIKPTQMCDGKRDCPDGSDENCLKRCPYRTDFLCEDRRSCVPKSLVCDGRAHCHDGSDEVSCAAVAAPAPHSNLLKCHVGSRLCRDESECVLFTHVCDGERDCRDGSDEEECDAAHNADLAEIHKSRSPAPVEPSTEPPTKPPCTSPSVLCPGSSLCIKPTQMCDGKRDCPDGSDENCVNRCPYRTDFLCEDRRSCVSKSLVCDGRAHCHDGSDEVSCAAVAAPAPRANLLKCHVGSRLCRDESECVLFTHVCDGERDCRDGSDEEQCDPAHNADLAEIHKSRSPAPVVPSTEPPTKPPCTSPSVLCPGSSLCIKPTQMCDGKRDCPDGSDENCVNRCPYRTDFRCKDRRSCVPKSLVCDGRSHCHDGSDEVSCAAVAAPAPHSNLLKCHVGSRLCRDESECVLFTHVCDGERDCRDGSDEEQCDAAKIATNPENPPLNKPPAVALPSTQPPHQPTCTSPSVLCPGSSLCIKPTQMCDGKRDCPDGSDENCLTRCSYTNQILCNDRRSCISKDLVCDGRAHCHDGSDELDCPSESPPASRTNVLKCRKGSRLCNDGTECVLYSHLCDGENDCVDGSDERGCPGTCKQDEFQCSHGKMCIPATQVCDGISQCQDQSDELDCRQQTKSCEYLCPDGQRCIPKKFLCDGERDCVDGTDEEGCEDPATTAEPLHNFKSACVAPSVLCPGSSMCIAQNQLCDAQRDCPDGFDEKDCVFRCKNRDDFLCSDRRKCVSKVEVCDGRSHCSDGSDEMQCRSEGPVDPSNNVLNDKSAPLKCSNGFKLCKDGLDCVMYSHVCDGERDCHDGSDEEGCAVECKEGEFQCSHGKSCIPLGQVCDGEYNCQDRSDEMDCSKMSEGCHQRCDNNTRCIPKTFLCDGERDCADGSDEANCVLVACAINQYRCTSGQCVSEALRCDGYADCSDRSDEMDCTRPPRCPAHLRCLHGHECLQKEWLCDGENDCEDGSDEKNCVTPAAKCREYQWQCGDSSQCIPLSWKCDGKKDCHNGADEGKCRQKNCPAPLYQCGSGECVDPGLVCNGFTNCADSSDEGAGCAQRNCSSPSAPRCEHGCVSTPNGARCYCAAGFTQPSAVSCADIDECNIAPHAVCKHNCRNTRGSYTCYCNPGFFLEPDNKSCKTKDEPLLLASVQSELLLLGVHSGTLRLLSFASRPVFSLDYHWARQRVYWLSSDYQSIRWTDMNGSNKKGTLIKGVKSDFIAVDWVGKNLYWVDGLVGQILAVKLSDMTVRSQDYTVVLGEDLEQPSSLVLLPHRGLMLWSEIGSTPQIEQSGMDGSQRKVVVSQGLSWPVSLAYDLLDDRVYWADEKLRCIGSASLDGDQVKILQLAETPSPFSVGVFNDRLFWSDTKRRTIRSADKNTGKDQKVLLKRPGQPFGLKLMHALSQPVTPSPCNLLHCSHLCLLAPAERGQSGAPGAPVVRGLTAVCRCPKGLLLSKDKITCSLPMETSFMLLLSPTTVYQIYLHTLQKEGVALKKMPTSRVLPLPGVTEASGLDVSIHELFLYVADAGQGTVDVLKLSGSRSRQGLTPAGQILKLKEDPVTALAVDWVTSNLYWSSTNRPDLHVTSHHKGYTTSLLQGSLKGTTSIALHPPSGRLCYTAIVASDEKSQTKVNCAWMDGRDKAVLWRESLIPTSLGFSHEGSTIYWADPGEGVISSIGVDGSGYKQYKTGPGLLISFAQTENFLLWITLDKGVTKLWFSDGLQPKQLWFETKTSLVEVKAFSNNTQSGTNGCSDSNGGCSHLCLAFPGGRTCKCGEDFYSVGATSCAHLHDCPDGERSCLDGTKCISSSRFCDGRVDCQDQSDEQDCPNTNNFGSTAGDDRHPESAPPQPNIPEHKHALEVKDCDPQHCHGQGRCVTEGEVARCQCSAGYNGEFCQETEGGHHPGVVILGVICLVALLMAAAFIFAKRRAWASIRSRSIEKETLMANMGLPCEDYDSESEDLDSPDDTKNPALMLKTLKPK